MARTIKTTPSRLPQALIAIGNLTLQELNATFSSGQTAALAAHTEIATRPVNQKCGVFFRHFIPLRNEMVAVLAENFRRYFKLALAHSRQSGTQPEEWGWIQLQSAVIASLESIVDWYILACDGENRNVRHVGSTEFVPGQTAILAVPLTVQSFPPTQSWRAPSWLFQISLALVGVGPLKEKHVPQNDSEKKLGAAHTRLLLKGTRRVFLWELAAAIERVQNEEMAAAGATPAELATTLARGPNKRKGWEDKIKLHAAIRKVLDDNPRLQGVEFCAALDKRHAPPLFEWVKRGGREGFNWKEAWRDGPLKRKIRRVRQEAMKNR